MKPSSVYPPCTRGKLVVAPLLGWNHAGKLLSYALNAKRILEYGSGGSTLWLAMHCPEARILSIEHDRNWFTLVNHAAAGLLETGIIGQNVAVALRPVDDYAHNSYIDVVMPFNLIFIDGAHTTRTPCLKAAADLLSLGGVVFLDNSEEPEYQEGKTFLLAQPGMTLIEETEDETWDPKRSRRHLWIAQKAESNPA